MSTPPVATRTATPSPIAGDGAVTPPPEPTPTVVQTPPVLPPERRLPEHKGKLGRIVDHVGGAAKDVRALAQLRVELLKVEAKQKVNARRAAIEHQVEAHAKAYVPAGLLLVGGAILLLVALGFTLSASAWSLFEWSPLWSLAFGFTISFLLLALGALAWFKTHTPIPPPSQALHHDAPRP